MAPKGTPEYQNARAETPHAGLKILFAGTPGPAPRWDPLEIGVWGAPEFSVTIRGARGVALVP